MQKEFTRSDIIDVPIFQLKRGVTYYLPHDFHTCPGRAVTLVEIDLENGIAVMRSEVGELFEITQGIELVELSASMATKAGWCADIMASDKLKPESVPDEHKVDLALAYFDALKDKILNARVSYHDATVSGKQAFEEYIYTLLSKKSLESSI